MAEAVWLTLAVIVALAAGFRRVVVALAMEPDLVREAVVVAAVEDETADASRL